MILLLWVTLSLLALAGYALAVIGVPRWAHRRMEIDALVAAKDWEAVDTGPFADSEDREWFRETLARWRSEDGAEREKNREWMREMMGEE